jgi:hypothetical protein
VPEHIPGTDRCEHVGVRTGLFKDCVSIHLSSVRCARWPASVSAAVQNAPHFS